MFAVFGPRESPELRHFRGFSGPAAARHLRASCAHVARYAGKVWTLLDPVETYRFAGRDDQAWETDIGGFGRTFPHSYGAGDGKYYTTLLTLSPAGDELTLDFALALVEAEAIGADDVTDYLSISLSSTDYVGHIFGPSSLESEDNIRRLDRTLETLFARIDAIVGLDKTLIILSSDHDVHTAKLRVRGNAVCTQCHSPAGNSKFPTLRRVDYGAESHHFHRPGSQGAQCKS